MYLPYIVCSLSHTALREALQRVSIKEKSLNMITLRTLSEGEVDRWYHKSSVLGRNKVRIDDEI